MSALSLYPSVFNHRYGELSWIVSRVKGIKRKFWKQFRTLVVITLAASASAKDLQCGV